MRKRLLVLFVVLFLAACASGPAEKAPDPLAVQLKWVHQAQFAGFYLAQAQGHYEQENLSVALLEAGPGIPIVEQVLAGEADFGVAAPEDILMHRAEGEPLVAIATIYRRNPAVIAALPASGITRPRDLLGRQVAVAGVTDLEILFRALINKLDLDITEIDLVPYSYDLVPLYQGEVDATAFYATGGLIRMREAGYKPTLIWPSDYGVHFYADTLFTTEQMVAENPALVTRFLRATLQGWSQAIEDPAAAVAATLDYAKEGDAALQREMMAASVPLVHTGRDEIGWMRGRVWQEMHDILLSQGLLSEPLDVHQVYTLRFLRDIYGDDQ